VVGTVLLIAIAVALAALVLLLFHLPNLGWPWPGEPPSPIELQRIYHESEIFPYPLVYDSRIILYHNGTESWENDLLMAKIYKNQTLLSCRVTTMNGHEFITTHHDGVQTMGGTGCQTDRWNPGERIALDLTDGTLRPGDRVRVDIIYKPDNTVISRDEIVG
jgi:hypothetical protein